MCVWRRAFGSRPKCAGLSLLRRRPAPPATKEEILLLFSAGSFRLLFIRGDEDIRCRYYLLFKLLKKETSRS